MADIKKITLPDGTSYDVGNLIEIFLTWSNNVGTLRDYTNWGDIVSGTHTAGQSTIYFFRYTVGGKSVILFSTSYTSDEADTIFYSQPDENGYVYKGIVQYAGNTITITRVEYALTTTVPSTASIDNSGLITYKNTNNTNVFTLQLPLYDGSVTGGNPGSNRYVVTITYDENEDEYVADKTFAEVYAACEAGKVVQAYIDEWGVNISLNFYSDTAISFGHLEAETIYLYDFIIGNNDVIEVYDVQLQPV